MEMERSLFAFVKEVAPEKANWDVEWVASDATLDRQDEIIDPEAWILGPYMRNAVILACHQHRLPDGSSPVVARADDTGVKDGQLIQRPLFAAREPYDTELGIQYCKLYRGRFMKAASVGFQPIKGAWDEKTIDGKKVKVYHHTKVELYEVSCVPVGANPNALAKYLASRSLALGAPSPRTWG